MATQKKSHKLLAMEEILSSSPSELHDTQKSLRSQLAYIRLTAHTDNKPQVAQSRRLKKSLARVLTVLSRYEGLADHHKSTTDGLISTENTGNFLAGKLSHAYLQQHNKRSKTLAKKTRKN